jgi:hypothetical protein
VPAPLPAEQPERIDFVGFVLQISELGSLVGLVLALGARRGWRPLGQARDTGRRLRGLVMFLVLGVVHELG